MAFYCDLFHVLQKILSNPAQPEQYCPTIRYIVQENIEVFLDGGCDPNEVASTIGPLATLQNVKLFSGQKIFNLSAILKVIPESDYKEARRIIVKKLSGDQIIQHLDILLGLNFSREKLEKVLSKREIGAIGLTSQTFFELMRQSTKEHLLYFLNQLSDRTFRFFPSDEKKSAFIHLFVELAKCREGWRADALEWVSCNPYIIREMMISPLFCDELRNNSLFPVEVSLKKVASVIEDDIVLSLIQDANKEVMSFFERLKNPYLAMCEITKYKMSYEHYWVPDLDTAPIPSLEDVRELPRACKALMQWYFSLDLPIDKIPYFLAFLGFDPTDEELSDFLRSGVEDVNGWLEERLCACGKSRQKLEKAAANAAKEAAIFDECLTRLSD